MKNYSLSIFFLLLACARAAKPVNYRQMVLSQFNELMPEMVVCYKVEKKLFPRNDFSQEMKVRFVINSDGSTSKVNIEHGSTVPFPVQSCIKRIVAKTNFSKPPESNPVLITAPLSVTTEKN